MNIIDSDQTIDAQTDLCLRWLQMSYELFLYQSGADTYITMVSILAADIFGSFGITEFTWIRLKIKYCPIMD